MTYRPAVAFGIAIIGLIGWVGVGHAQPCPGTARAGQSVSPSLHAAMPVGVAAWPSYVASNRGANPWGAGRPRQQSRKSPLGAVLRSLGSTLVPTAAGLLMLQGRRPVADWGGGAVLASGLIVGPAVGHFYAKNDGQAWRGIAVRGGAGIGFGFTTVLAAASLDGNYLGNYLGADDEGSEIAGVAAIVTLLASGLVLGVRTLYDITEADDAARAYNNKAGLAVRPRVNPVQRQAGLAMQWIF